MAARFPRHFHCGMGRRRRLNVFSSEQIKVLASAPPKRFAGMLLESIHRFHITHQSSCLSSRCPVRWADRMANADRTRSPRYFLAPADRHTTVCNVVLQWRVAMTSFEGIWVPLITPFHDGRIDFPALQALACSIVDAGVSGLVACGSTAEAAALDDDEQLAVLDAIIAAVPGCPVVMGLAGNRQAAMLEKMQKIQRRRIAGLLIPAPYYIRPSQEGLRGF